MSSDLLCQVKPNLGRVAVGNLSKIENPENLDEYSYPQIAKVAVRKGTMNKEMLRDTLLKEYQEAKQLQHTSNQEVADYEAGRADGLSLALALLEKDE